MSGPMRGPMGGGGHGRMLAASGKPKDAKGTVKRLFSFMRPYRTGAILVVLFAVLGTGLSNMGPAVLGFATNQLHLGAQRILSGTGGMDFAATGRILMTLAAIYLLSALFTYLQHFIIAGVSQRTMYGIRKAVDQKLKRLPLRYFDGNSFGDILSRVTNDVDTVATSLQQGINQVISSIITVVTILVMMLYISPLLTLVALLTLPLTALASVNVVKMSQKLFQGQVNSQGALSGYVEEMYTGHNVVKAFGKEADTVQRFGELNDELYRYSWKAQFLSGVIMPITNFFTNLGYIVVAVLGAFMVIQGKMLVGSIQSFIQYIRQFSQPVVQAANLANMLQATIAAAERVFAFLDEEEEPADMVPEELPRFDHGSVSFQHVRFGYRPDQTLIKDLNLEIHPGQTVAIVGPTGAGKTTLVNLILRFYDVSGGRILIDGADITTVPREHLRSCIGMVLQDTWLFSGTIRENIRYGRLSATDEEVEAAARAAKADDFIRSLPDGYETVLGEDAFNISQGQRQLLTIARAILSDPRILILDEATSSVDTRTEVLIQKAMLALMEDRTSFVIAHRLSTIRDADKILVMEHGDIVESGTHRELLELGGAYARLYRSQFENREAS